MRQARVLSDEAIIRYEGDPIREKALFLDRFAVAAERIRRGEILFAQPAPLPETQPETLIRYARLLVPLEGAMPFVYGDGEGVRDRMVVPGQAVYARPFGWSHPGWDRRMEFVSLVFRNDCLRFLHILHDGAEPPPDGVVTGRTIYHTRLAPGPAVDLLLGVMNHFASRPPEHRRHAPACLALLIDESLEQLRRDDPAITGKRQRLLRDIQEYLQDHFHRPINRDSVARQFKLHPSHLSRLFSRNGENFNAYLTTLRLDHARHLLEHTDYPVKQIAALVGFQSDYYFIKVFSKQFGFAPGAFRDRARSFDA